MLTDDGSLANPEAGPYRLSVGNKVKHATNADNPAYAG
jgi:hypothetical protein